ncbi:hypothetical protein J7K43_06015 [Candidatus Calescamantes bacterium]|nr:hypothetical protein [Candidatus Calescamantes bacterium]
MQATLKEDKVVVEFDLNEVDEDILSLLTSMEISKKSYATQEDILKLSEEIKKKWWKKNKKQTIDIDEDSSG